MGYGEYGATYSVWVYQTYNQLWNYEEREILKDIEAIYFFFSKTILSYVK